MELFRLIKNKIHSYILKENKRLMCGSGWQVALKWESVIFQFTVSGNHLAVIHGEGEII